MVAPTNITGISLSSKFESQQAGEADERQAGHNTSFSLIQTEASESLEGDRASVHGPIWTTHESESAGLGPYYGPHTLQFRSCMFGLTRLDHLKAQPESWHSVMDGPTRDGRDES